MEEFAGFLFGTIAGRLVMFAVAIATLHAVA